MSRRAKLTALWGSVAAAGTAMVYSLVTDSAW